MRLLILNRDLPVFPGRAGHEYLHTTRLARHGHEVGLVSLLHTREQEDEVQGLADAGVRLYLWRSPQSRLASPPGNPGPRRLVRRVAEAVYNLGRNWRRYPADTLVQDMQFRNIAGPLIQALAEKPWQALVVVQSDCARWLDYVPRPPVSVLVMHDVRALVYERQAAVAPSFRERLACRREARRYRRFEREHCRRFDLVVTVSPADEAWVRTHYRPRRLVTVPIPVDRSYFAPLPGIPERAGRIVFSGMMSHPPNVDAAVFFARDVLPLVRARVPDAEFWIVGRDVIPPVARLATRPGVVVTGFVPDIRPHLAEAAVVVVPLRFGSGMRNKILEAWAMEKCVVSTRLGAEGLACDDGVSILLGDTARALADRVVEALRDPGLRDRIRAHGRRLVSSSHDPDALAHRYADAIGQAIADTGPRDAPLRAVIDLRARSGVGDGIEDLSRPFLDELIGMDHVNRYTVLLPPAARRRLDLRAGPNFQLVTAGGSRVIARQVALGALRLLHRGLRLTYWQSPDVETLRRAAALDAEVALSIDGLIHPDLAPLGHVALIADIGDEPGPEMLPCADLDERRCRLAESARRAAHICAVSEFVRQRLMERFHVAPERVTTTPLAADPIFEPGSRARGDHARVLARYGLLSGEYLLLPGDARPRGNRAAAVEALRVLRDADGLAPLLVCTGSVEDAEGELRARIRAAGLEARVRFLGRCPRSDMPALYEGAAALLFPSLHEGFPLPLLEAMWCDCPIVCSDTTSLPEIAGDAALLVDPRSPEALAHAVRRVLTDQAERRALIERGRRRVTRFTWRAFTVAIVSALHRARERRRA